MEKKPHSETETFLAWAGKVDGEFIREDRGFGHPVFFPKVSQASFGKSRSVRVKVTMTMEEVAEVKTKRKAAK